MQKLSLMQVAIALNGRGLAKVAINTIPINIGIDAENQTLINHLGSAETEH